MEAQKYLAMDGSYLIVCESQEQANFEAAQYMASGMYQIGQSWSQETLHGPRWIFQLIPMLVSTTRDERGNTVSLN